MATKTCVACGKPGNAHISMGGTSLCRTCSADIEIEVNKLRAEGKPVNVANIARRIFRETYCAGDYLLRDIPKELWNEAKHASIDKGLSLRELILEALESYIKNIKE
jgi:hypothetical protein